MRPPLMPISARNVSDAVADERGELLTQDLLGRVGDDHVERVVDRRLGVRVVHGLLDDGAERHAAVLRREGDHGRRAAAGGRARAREEIVRGHEADRGALFDMAMRVDSAGHDELAARVDLLFAIGEVFAERGDAPALDADVGAERLRRRRNLPAADDEIEWGHGIFLPCVRAIGARGCCARAIKSCNGS